MDTNEPISVPVNATDELYKMDHEKRGYALIFSHENFEPNLNLSKREGTRVLAKKLEKTLKELNFDAEIFDDYKLKKIKEKVEELSKKSEDLKNSDCIMIIIMTHGLYDDTLYSKESHYTIDQLQAYFFPEQCKCLAGKPKLFIIQSCRGKQQQEAVDLQDTTIGQTDGSMSQSENVTYKIPAHADFLTAFCTASGQTAYRQPFIKAFCEELSSKEVKDGQIDFLSMLTIVQRKVAIRTSKEKKQIPSVTSTLTRKIFF